MVVVVTGASSGLGVPYAKALAVQGADIVVTARLKARVFSKISMRV